MHSILKYVALTGSVLVIWLYPQKQESAFADCNSPELDTSDIDDRVVDITVTVNELVLAILFGFAMFLVHRKLRLQRTYKLYNELKDVEFLKQGETFRSLCRQKQRDIDEIMKIHESLLTFKNNEDNDDVDEVEDEEIRTNNESTSEITTEVEYTEDETTSIQTDVVAAVGDCCQLPSQEIKRRIKHVPPPPRSIRSTSAGSRLKSFKRL